MPTSELLAVDAESSSVLTVYIFEQQIPRTNVKKKYEKIKKASTDSLGFLLMYSCSCPKPPMTSLSLDFGNLFFSLSTETDCPQ